MATSTARPARPLPKVVPHGERLPRDASAVSIGAAEDSSRRDPAWLVDLTDRITRSVDAIERVVERVGTMREDNSYLRTVTASLRDALEAERTEAGRRLVEQGRSISQQKRRTAEAERSADALAGMLCDLEQQLSSRRGAVPAAGSPSYEGSFRQGERANGERMGGEPSRDLERDRLRRAG